MIAHHRHLLRLVLTNKPMTGPRFTDSSDFYIYPHSCLQLYESNRDTPYTSTPKEKIPSEPFFDLRIVPVPRPPQRPRNTILRVSPPPEDNGTPTPPSFPS